MLNREGKRGIDLDRAPDSCWRMARGLVARTCVARTRALSPVVTSQRMLLQFTARNNSLGSDPRFCSKPTDTNQNLPQTIIR